MLKLAKKQHASKSNVTRARFYLGLSVVLLPKMAFLHPYFEVWGVMY